MLTNLTVMNVLALCAFASALVLGLVAYTGSLNAPWAKLNNDGRTIVIGGVMCAVAGIIALVLCVLEAFNIIPIVVL